MISKSVLALAGLIALLWAGSAFAQSAGNLTTTCPLSFVCGFSSAETRAFSSKAQPPQQAGAPDVYIGYIAFDSTPYPNTKVTVSTIGLLNGTFSPGTIVSASCVNGSSGSPATLNFANGGPQWMFVTVNSGAGANGEELDFIQTQDVAGSNGNNSNAVRVGVCRSPAP